MCIQRESHATKAESHSKKNQDGSYKLDKAGNKMKIGGVVAYAWFVFDASYDGYPEIRWLNTPELKEEQVSLF